ncbi:MAG: GGDEF domain-containing protein [Robiginitomaculum sp.]|nr:GGDEF domain-containing protein [Robiginitomaculum sp.]
MTNKSKKTTSTDPIQLMQGLNVEPSPINYELFYNFTQASNQALVKAMQPYTSGKKSWDNSVAETLHHKHIANDRIHKILDDTTKSVGDELKSVMKVLEQAGQDAASYGKVLEGAGGNLVDVSDPRSIRDIVEHLLQATADMQSRSNVLESKLAKTNQQVETLQGNLDRVKIEAMTDSLSGLCNRKRFDEVLKDEMEQSAKTKEPLALVFCDIDHFKRFNDTWGHQTGDQIIRFVSSTLKRHVSKHHVAARYGGEEFAIIMPATDLSVAIDVAQNIREKIERKKLVRKSTNEDLGKVTISMGVSLFRDTDEIEEFIERADMALYQSKQNGRNRLSVEAATEKAA